MYSKSKVCDDGMLQQSGGFEDDTFRHLLSEKRTILVNNVIGDNIIERVIIPIISINEMDDELESEAKNFIRKDNPIKIFINSNGGDATSTLSAISAIEQSKTPVHTYGFAKAFSGGFYMLAAGHKRFCQVYSTLMYHQLQMGIPYSDMTTSKEHIEEALRVQDMLDGFMLRRTKLKQKQLDSINSKKVDWYLNSQDALRYGIVDSIYY
jgi:ATP-dependent Clp protease protease subunit